MFARYFCRCDLTWYIVRPLTPISVILFRICFGVAVCGPCKASIAFMNLLCSSWVHLIRAFVWPFWGDWLLGPVSTFQNKGSKFFQLVSLRNSRCESRHQVLHTIYQVFRLFFNRASLARKAGACACWWKGRLSNGRHHGRVQVCVLTAHHHWFKV